MNVTLINLESVFVLNLQMEQNHSFHQTLRQLCRPQRLQILHFMFIQEILKNENYIPSPTKLKHLNQR